MNAQITRSDQDCVAPRFGALNRYDYPASLISTLKPWRGPVEEEPILHFLPALTTSNAKEAEVERFYEHLQDLLELTPPKDVLFIIGVQNAKVRSQEIPGVTGKFGLEIQNEAFQVLTEFCQENTLVIANTLFQQQKR